MNNELSILKQALNYTQYKEIDSLLDVGSFSKELQGLYRALSRFHQDNPEHILSVADLANIYPVTKDKEYYSGVFDTLQNLEVKHESVVYLLREMQRQVLAKKMSMAAYEVSEGNAKADETFTRLLDEWK